MANLAEIVSGLAVVAGIGFGVMEYRRHKVNERREAAASLARSFQTRDLATSIRFVLELSGPLCKRDYEALNDEDKNLIWILFTSMESIGILVDRGDLSLELVDAFFSIPVAEGWRRLQPFVEEQREELGSPQAWEWYQWLAERLAERHRSHPRIPAHHPGRS